MNIDELLDTQCKERYKSVIICGAGMTGKTKMIKSFADRKQALYIDVLDKVNSDTSLTNRVEVLKPETVFEWIKQNDGKEYVVLDQIDFLFSLWSDTVKREFVRKLDIKSNGTCVVTVLHNYKLLEENLMKKNSKGQSRIVNVSELA